MAVNESVEGVDSIAITGIAAGVSSLGLLGKGEAVGVRGESQKWHAVVDLNSGDQGAGVYSHSNGTGVIRKSKSWMGIYGRSHNTTGGAGLMGETQGSGVIGKSQTWMGVYGETPSTTGGAGVCGEHKANGSGVAGKSGGGAGVFGTSGTNAGVYAETGVVPAVLLARHRGGGVAGRLESDVVGENGCLFPCTRKYDGRVSGVVSGAGHYKPPLMLDSQLCAPGRQPIALVGKVFCRVDAHLGAVVVDDPLTASPTEGHAMRAVRRAKAFGAGIGKVLQPLAAGQGRLGGAGPLRALWRNGGMACPAYDFFLVVANTRYGRSRPAFRQSPEPVPPASSPWRCPC